MSKLIAVYDDKESLNNVMTSLTLDIDEVFFVYHHKVDKKDLYNVERVLKRNKEIVVHFKQLEDDEKEIEEILKNNPDIIVEVSAVKYLSLLLFEYALENKMQIVYYDNEENCIKDYMTHQPVDKEIYHLHIVDVMNLRGGELISNMHQPIAEKITRKTIEELVETNISHYSAFIHTIQKLNSRQIEKLKYEINEENRLFIKNNYRYINKLIEFEDNILTVRNDEYRKLISISGSFLENYLFNKLVESKYFDEVMMSVVIDFSSGNSKDIVRCEIDSLVMYNNKLLFVSCKSNKASTDTLNEIYAHNSMFGNSLSDAVLVIVDDLSKYSPSIYAKAKELDIKIVDFTDFINGEIVERFKEIMEDIYIYESNSRIYEN